MDGRPVELIPCESVTIWDRLVAVNGGCFFQRHAFLDVLADTLDLKFRPFLVRVGGEPVGVAPVVARRLGPFHTINWLPFPYVGPLVPPDLLTGTLVALRGIERDLRAVRSQHVLQPGETRDGDLAGYTESRDRTFVMDLREQTEDSLLRRVSGKRRAKLRRAVALGATVREATRYEICEVLASWSAAVFEAQGIPAPYTPSCFAAVWSRFARSSEARFSTAVLDGEPVCVQASFAGAPRAVAWTIAGAGTEVASRVQPLLYWDTILWAMRAGCAEFDLVGAPTEGIARHKREWGATERTYSVFRRQAAAHRALMSVRDSFGISGRFRANTAKRP